MYGITVKTKCRNKIIKIPAKSIKNIYKISEPLKKPNYQENGLEAYAI